MTTPRTTTTPDPIVRPPLPSTLGHRVRRALREAGELVLRSMVHLVRQPAELVGTLAFPIVSVLLFGYVFGSAISVPGGADYRTYLMPGLFGMTMMLGMANSAMYMVTDTSRGVTDRFRAMPLARSSVLVGRAGADMLLSVVDLTVLVAMGLVVGWRADGDVLAVVGALALLLWLRLAMVWVGIWLGMIIRTPETAMKAFSLILPLAMLSNAFVAPELMPGWLQVIAEWNPMSSTVAASRELFGNAGGVTDGTWIASNATLMAIVWPAAILCAALPAALGRYRRMSR